MGLIPNITKELLARGEVAIGFSVLHSRTANIANIAKSCGYDWLWVDGEHGFMSTQTATDICIAALGCGITPLVRVPGPEDFHVSKMLDGGAQGIIFPHINNAEEARSAVQTAKYPPKGHRSHTGAKPQLGYERVSIAESIEIVNENILVGTMLETQEGIDNVEEIAAVEGVDILFIGTQDLSIDMGVPGELNHEGIQQAYEKMISAAVKNGKAAGMGGVYDDSLIPGYIDMGVRFVLAGTDYEFMANAARQRSEQLRTLLKPNV